MPAKIKKPRVTDRTLEEFLRPEGTRTPAKVMSRKSRTEQNHRESTNINAIIATFQANEQMPRLNPKDQFYGDFETSVDYHTQYNRVLAVQDEYDRLPARLREATGNDPAILFEMLETPEAHPTLQRAGLVLEGVPPLPPEPDPARPSPASEQPAAQPAAPPKGDKREADPTPT